MNPLFVLCLEKSAGMTFPFAGSACTALAISPTSAASRSLNDSIRIPICEATYETNLALSALYPLR